MPVIALIQFRTRVRVRVSNSVLPPRSWGPYITFCWSAVVKLYLRF